MKVMFILHFEFKSSIWRIINDRINDTELESNML